MGLTEEIEKQSWTFAKTFANSAPHSYFIRAWNPELFDLLIQEIEEKGVNEIFRLYRFEKEYRYLYLGEYRYWQDGIVMNRVKVENIYHQDGISYQVEPKLKTLNDY